jgi:preprotein translocase subunit SecY
MWEKLRNIWFLPDLRKKILFTLMILLLTRVLANIPVPLAHVEVQNLVKLF